MDAIKVREYKQTFTDSVLTADVTIKSRGYVDNIGFSYTVFPFQYKEKLITRETLKIAKYRLIMGVYYDNDFNAVFRVQTRNGFMYSIGRSFKGKTMIGVDKTIFTKW